MGKYAENTTVNVDRSRAEIERTLERYGATGFMYGRDGTQAMLAFRLNGRMIRFVIRMPDRDDPQFKQREVTRSNQYVTRTTHKQLRADEQIVAWEQACRQRWRALALIIKAKLEAGASGIVTFEQEFLAHTLLPDGQTVGDWMEPQVQQAYLTGTMPALLPGLPSGAVR